MKARAELIALSEKMWEEGRINPPNATHWRGCLLVNPLCPSDLCVLPAGHVGTKEGWHVLGTDPYDQPYRYTGMKRAAMFMAEEGATQDDLVRLGWEKQRELFPEED